MMRGIARHIHCKRKGGEDGLAGLVPRNSDGRRACRIGLGGWRETFQDGESTEGVAELRLDDGSLRMLEIDPDANPVADEEIR